MKRQTKQQGLAERWSAHQMDIDPFRLPAQFSLPVKTMAGRLLRACDRIEIEPAAIAIEREMLGARCVRQEIALDEFSGVAIRAELIGEDEDIFAISVNLHHENPEFCIPLHVSFDMSDVNARWQSWGRALGLPLLLPSPDGTWCQPVEKLGKISVSSAIQRKPRKMLASRRSRYSMIRDTGHSRPMLKFCGEEIIARR